MTGMPVSSAAEYSGKNIARPERGVHHFLHIDDFSKEDLLGMLQTALRVKAKLKGGEFSYRPFVHKTMAMVFAKPSLRTRVSFEAVRRWYCLSVVAWNIEKNCNIIS
jgi:ornithine carbamoyltransferase